VGERDLLLDYWKKKCNHLRGRKVASRRTLKNSKERVTKKKTFPKSTGNPPRRKNSVCGAYNEKNERANDRSWQLDRLGRGGKSGDVGRRTTRKKKKKKKP